MDSLKQRPIRIWNRMYLYKHFLIFNIRFGVWTVWDIKVQDYVLQTDCFANAFLWVRNQPKEQDNENSNCDE